MYTDSYYKGNQVHNLNQVNQKPISFPVKSRESNRDHNEELISKITEESQIKKEIELESNTISSRNEIKQDNYMDDRNDKHDQYDKKGNINISKKVLPMSINPKLYQKKIPKYELNVNKHIIDPKQEFAIFPSKRNIYKENTNKLMAGDNKKSNQKEIKKEIKNDTKKNSKKDTKLDNKLLINKKYTDIKVNKNNNSLKSYLKSNFMKDILNFDRYRSSSRNNSKKHENHDNNNIHDNDNIHDTKRIIPEKAYIPGRTDKELEKIEHTKQSNTNTAKKVNVLSPTINKKGVYNVKYKHSVLQDMLSYKTYKGNNTFKGNVYVDELIKRNINKYTINGNKINKHEPSKNNFLNSNTNKNGNVHNIDETLINNTNIINKTNIKNYLQLDIIKERDDNSKLNLNAISDIRNFNNLNTLLSINNLISDNTKEDNDYKEFPVPSPYSNGINVKSRNQSRNQGNLNTKINNLCNNTKRNNDSIFKTSLLKDLSNYNKTQSHMSNKKVNTVERFVNLNYRQQVKINSIL